MNTAQETAALFTGINRAQNLAYHLDTRGAVDQLNDCLLLLGPPPDPEALTLADVQAVMSPLAWQVLKFKAAQKKAGAK